MLEQPGSVERGVIPHHIHHTEHAPVTTHFLHQFANFEKGGLDGERFGDTLAVLEGGLTVRGGVASGEIGGVHSKLVRDGVSTVRATELVDGGEVYHVVASFLGHQQPLLPFFQGT